MFSFGSELEMSTVSKRAGFDTESIFRGAALALPMRIAVTTFKWHVSERTRGQQRWSSR